MPPRRRRRVITKTSPDTRKSKESVIPKMRDRAKGLGHISDLFDGKMWEIDPNKDLTPVTWRVNDADWVVVNGTEDEQFSLKNWVLRDLSASQVQAYGVENGWSLFSVQLRAICEVMGLNEDVLCEQRRSESGSTYLFKSPQPLEL